MHIIKSFSAIVFVSLFASCFFFETETAPARAPLIEAPEVESRTTVVRRADISRTSEKIAVAYPAQRSYLYFSADGRVEDLAVSTSGFAAEGTELIRLDSGDLPYRVRQTALDLEAARLSYEAARLDREYGLISRNEFRLIEISLEKKQNELDYLGNSLEDRIIRAPYDCVIDYLAVKEGEPVRAYDTIMAVSAPGSMSLMIKVRDSMYGDYLAAGEVLITHGDTTYTASLEPADNPLPTGGDSDRYFRLLSGNGGLPPLEKGSTYRVTVTLETRESVLTVDRNAVRTYFGSSYVRQRSGGAIRDVEVSIGLETDEIVEITGGIEEDSEVLLW